MENENRTVLYWGNRQHQKKKSELLIQAIQLDQVDDSSTPKSAVASIPTLTAKLVDKPLVSNSDESGTNQHLRSVFSKKARVSCTYLCEENKSTKVQNSARKVKLSRLLLQCIIDFQMSEINAKRYSKIPKLF